MQANEEVRRMHADTRGITAEELGRRAQGWSFPGFIIVIFMTIFYIKYYDLSEYYSVPTCGTYEEVRSIVIYLIYYAKSPR